MSGLVPCSVLSSLSYLSIVSESVDLFLMNRNIRKRGLVFVFIRNIVSCWSDLGVGESPVKRVVGLIPALSAIGIWIVVFSCFEDLIFHLVCPLSAVSYHIQVGMMFVHTAMMSCWLT